MKFASAIAGALLLGVTSSLPSYQALQLQERQSETGANAFIAPGPDDSRGPCPALNTLANHGYIPRNGKDMSTDMLIQGFRDGFGIDQSVISIAINNAFSVCRNVTGEACGALVNLTILATPHMFEHDHSFSRQDFMMAYQEAPTNNIDFNETIFDTSLAVLQGSDHMTIQQMNEVRLQRESLSLQEDKPGWFQENIPIQEVESAFIFALMGDFTLPDFLTEPKVRVSWWHYWFANQSFPEPLGWHKPDPIKSIDFVTSVSSRVLAAAVTSTPSPLPSGAIGPHGPATNGTIFSATATTDGSLGLGPTPVKRGVLPPRQVAASPTPTQLNAYLDPISPEQFGAMADEKTQSMSAFQASKRAAEMRYYADLKAKKA